MVDQVSSSHREVCRRAIGAELVSDARILAQLGLAEPPLPIPLHPALTRNDLELRWIGDLVAPIQETLTAFEEFDFSDPSVVGGRLRGIATDLLREAREVAELGSFLSEFGTERVASAYGKLATALWHRAALDVLLLTADDEEAVVRLVERRRRAIELELDADRDLEAQRSEPLRPLGPPDEVVTAALGEAPRRPLRNAYDFMNAYGRDPTYLFDLAMRQLRLLVSFPKIPIHFATSFTSCAVKIGTSTLPLYSHRVADATANLVAQAAEVDREAVGRLLIDFNRQQAGRIQAAGNDFEKLLAHAQAGGDDFAYPDAYRTLAEGILRPFGSLLVRMGELVVGGGAPAFVIFKTLGEVEDGMAVFGRVRPPAARVPKLLALGLDRPMRNYEAHEDIVRSGSGVLCVITRDGLDPLDLESLRVHLMILQAFLVGADVAFNVAVIPATGNQMYPADVIHTEAFVAGVTSIAIAEHSDAALIGCFIREGTMTIEIDGVATNAQLEAVTGSLRRLVDPAVERVEFVRSTGSLIYAADLGPPEERHVDEQHSDVERGAVAAAAQQRAPVRFQWLRRGRRNRTL